MSRALYKPDIKDYSPLIYGDVPDLAPGTLAYEEYWESVDDKVLYGYKPKGLKAITSKQFYYLNVWKIKLTPDGVDAKDKRKIIGSPWYRDMDHNYFDLIDSCKADQTGMIVVKARDKGFSMMNAGAVGHEYSMYPQNEVGVAAGLSVTADSFFQKVKSGLDNSREEYKIGILKENESLRMSGFKKRNKSGGWEEGGFGSKVHVRTMSNPNVFKGERLPLHIYEEAGEFSKLIEGYEASKACYMDGSEQIGVPIVGGTGGNIETSSKDFKTMWYTHESFNLQRLFIPASYVYAGFFNLKTGKSEIKDAEKHVKEERKKKKGEGYFFHIQNYPLTPEEAFMKTKNGAFDLAAINRQLARLEDSDWAEGLVEDGELEWVYPPGFTPHKNPKKRLESILKAKCTLKWVPKEKGLIKIYKHPELELPGLDVGGVDSIDQDETGSKSSDGSVVIYRRFYNLSKEYNLPIAYLKFRSDEADEFFEYVIKLAMYYNSKMLVEFTKTEVIRTMERLGLQKYLRERPTSVYESTEKSTANNRYGVHMYRQIKDAMIKLMKFEIKHYVDQIYFKELLIELADFGTRNTDIAMAYGIAVVNADDSYENQVEYTEDSENKPLGEPEHYLNQKTGSFQYHQSALNKTQELDPWGMN